VLGVSRLAGTAGGTEDFKPDVELAADEPL